MAHSQVLGQPQRQLRRLLQLRHPRQPQPQRLHRLQHRPRRRLLLHTPTPDACGSNRFAQHGKCGAWNFADFHCNRIGDASDVEREWHSGRKHAHRHHQCQRRLPATCDLSGDEWFRHQSYFAGQSRSISRGGFDRGLPQQYCWGSGSSHSNWASLAETTRIPPRTRAASAHWAACGTSMARNTF